MQSTEHYICMCFSSAYKQIVSQWRLFRPDVAQLNSPTSDGVTTLVWRRARTRHQTLDLPREPGSVTVPQHAANRLSFTSPIIAHSEIIA